MFRCHKLTAGITDEKACHRVKQLYTTCLNKQKAWVYGMVARGQHWRWSLSIFVEKTTHAGLQTVTKAQDNLWCENFKRILTAENENGDLMVTRTRCKQWTCPYCAVINREQWRARLINHINHSEHTEWGWFTITAHSNMRGDKLSISNLRSAWDKLMKRMKRHYGAFDYCRVYEPHKDNSFHAHAIVSFHFDDIKQRISRKTGEPVNYSEWMRKTAIDLSLGWYTHADNCDVGNHGGYIASYVTKYIVKLSPSDKKELGRIRHIQCSQSWTKLEKETELFWELGYFVTKQDYEFYRENGHRVIDIQTGEILTNATFSQSVVYPSED